MKYGDLLLKDSINKIEFNEFISDKKGIKYITKKELDGLIEHFGSNILGIVGFMEVYAIVNSDDVNRVMKNWTVINGIIAIILLACTLITAMPAIETFFQSLK